MTEIARRLAAIVSADVVGYSKLMGVDETGTLADLRAHDELADMVVLRRGNRLSITPVTPAEWRFITTRLMR